MPSKKGNGSGNSVEEETEMRPWLVSGMIVTILWGCAALSPVTVRDPIPQDYAFHRLESDDMSVHWNIVQGEGGVVAEGYVEHVGGPGILIRYVNVTLKGLDTKGRVVSKATDVPHRDLFHVGDQGLFRIAMPVTGREKTFLVRADYWWEPFDDNRRSIFWW